MKQDGGNDKTESQAAAMLCKKNLRCVSPKDHKPSQLGCLASKVSPGLTLVHLATSPKCRGKRRHSLQHGRDREESHCFHLCPVWSSLFCPYFSPLSALTVRENTQSLVVLKFNYPLTGVILGTCCYTCTLTLLPGITLKTKGLHSSVLTFITALFLSG